MVTACSPEGEHAPLPSEPDAITLAPGTPSVKEFPAMGGLWELRFSATKAWSVVPADPVHAEWYRIEPAEGDDGNGTVKVTVLPNITTEKRSAEIIIRSGRAEQRLSFVQHASDMEPCGEEEVRRFLEKLYQDTGGDNWRFQENWCTDKPLSCQIRRRETLADSRRKQPARKNRLVGVYGVGVASLREKFADGD